MNHLRVVCLASLLALNTQSVEARQAARDPDRGLDPALRTRMALIDASKDSWAVERWSEAFRSPLRELATAWSEGRLEEGLSERPWISPQLRVAPLFDAHEPQVNSTSKVWRVRGRTTSTNESVERVTLPNALSAWRRCFGQESRLDLEVIGVHGAPPRVEAQVRVTASGAGANGRIQHNAVWTCTWELEESSAKWVDLRVDFFEATTLGPDAQGVFTDVTATLFEDPSLFRERFEPGLEHWGRRLAATLFPGTLGHHGVALGDVDGDGLEDLYLCRPGGLPNQLLLHTSEHGLRDISASAGVDLLDYSSSALFVDFDGDGDSDLVVATGTGLVFFANDGRAKFERKHLLERSLATSLAAADYDGDGDVDLYACSYLSPYETNDLPMPYHDANNGEANMLLRNDGAWTFTDVTAKVGLDQNNRRFSLAAAWEDFDNDGDQDLYVVNDFGRNNLYRNQGGQFADIAPEFAAEDISAGMGAAWADIDHDGWMDLYVTNMRTPASSRLSSQPDFRRSSAAKTMTAYRDHAQGNTLLLNRNGRAFTDVAESSGTSFGRWGWGAIFLDFDNDGALDIFAPNGFVSANREPDLDSFFWRQVVLQSPDTAGEADASYSLGWRAVNRLVRQGFSWNGHERNVAYLNLGNTHFADVSSAVGLDHADDSRAAARVDWDGDGDEDLIVTNRTGPMLRVLLNQQATGHAWIAFDLRSRDPAHTSIGARVTLESSDGRTHLRTLHCGQGFLAQSTARLHFGLGQTTVRRVHVRWPNGDSEDFGAPAPGAVYTLRQGTATAHAKIAAKTALPSTSSATETTPRSTSARTVLPTPLPLPRLGMESADGQAAALFGITMEGPQGTGQPLVLILWSPDHAASRRELERIGAAANTLRNAGIRQVLALCIDSDSKQRERAHEAWNAMGWPFARGFISEEARQVLELVYGALHDDASGLFLPATFLIDPKGQLNATYQGALDVEQLRRDITLFPLDPPARRDASVPFPGRWVAHDAPDLVPLVTARLRAHQLERAAAEYELARLDVRALAPTDFEYELALVRARQGRMDEAIRQFRAALAKNPGHVLAAQALAVALHERGEVAPALKAYQDALKLEPAHAPTRFNFAMLLIATGDLAGAEVQLNALRSMKSDFATKLEAKLQEAKRQ